MNKNKMTQKKDLHWIKMSDGPQRSLCIFKQYTNDVVKPTYLSGAETLQITLTASLSFIVALSWNELFKSCFENMVGSFWKGQGLYKLMYAVIVTSFLFFFNIGVSACVTEMRKKAQIECILDKKLDKKLDEKSHTRYEGIPPT